MTKKDFEAIAAAFKRQKDFHEVALPAGDAVVKVALQDLATDLSAHFKASNPNFDRTRFIRACGF